VTGTLLLRFRFEAAHRLPVLGGKCANLHGHSWTVEVTVAGPVDPALGIIADAGDLKARLGGWIDSWLDHAALLGDADPLTKALADEGCRVFRFGAPEAEPAADLPWPTTEAVACLLHRAAEGVWAPWPGLAVVGVVVGEAPSISASWP
jgi:6-pyruvoyltetrahydropterin/6-carboxytetrahydropterin synthase